MQGRHQLSADGGAMGPRHGARNSKVVDPKLYFALHKWGNFSLLPKNFFFPPRRGASSPRRGHVPPASTAHECMAAPIQTVIRTLPYEDRIMTTLRDRTTTEIITHVCKN